MVASYSSQTSHKSREARNCNTGSIAAGHGSERSVRSRGVSTCEGQTRRRNHPIDSETQGIQKTRTEGVRFVQGKELPARIVSRPFIVELVGLPYSSAVKHVSARERVLRRKSMVNLGCKIIFRRDGLSCEGEYARVSGSRCARRKRAQQSPIR